MNLENLALLCYLLIGIIILIYVLLDGYDLGIGILSIFFPNSIDKDIMISVIMPVWDGNGTWLVFGGAVLYGAFPLAFSTIMPATYSPMIIMVVALLFRGIALEFRLKAHSSKNYWDFAFFLGSIVATICQALILSAIIGGFDESVHGLTKVRQWLNPLILIATPGLILGYALLGVNRLIAKTEGAIQERFFGISGNIQHILIIFMFLAILASPVVDTRLANIWYNSSLSLYFIIIGFMVLLLLALHIWAINKRQEYTPFWYAVLMFAFSFSGLILSTFPYLIPPKITYLQAAAPHSSLFFILIGVSICLPILLLYTAYAYYTFRGKLKQVIGY